jgi:hypothetical protein
VRNEGRVTTKLGSIPHGIWIHQLHAIKDVRKAIDGNSLTVPKIYKPSQIIYTGNMIRMSMSKYHPIDIPDLVGNALKSKLRRNIHLNGIVVQFDVNRSAGPPIFGILTGAYLTIAPNHGYPMRGPGSQKNNFHTSENHSI